MEFKKKKILIFLPAGVGGAERVGITIGKILKKNDFDVHFVIFGDSKSTINTILPQNSKCHYIKYNYIRWFRMRTLIKKEGADIVFAPYRSASRDLIMVTKPFGFKGKVIVRSDNPLRTLKSWQQWLVRKTFKYADTVIAQQEEMQEEIINEYPVPANKVIVIHNPIDYEKIDKQANVESPYRLTDNTNKYVWVARVSESKTKGHDYLLEAFKKVHETDCHSHLFFVGAYNEQGAFYKQLIAYIKENKLEDCVHFVGFDSNPHRWVKYADSFVLPSRVEGLPNALIEAMYLGKPVVASRCLPIIDRIVVDGINGYRVEIGDVGSMADAMRKSLELKDIKFTYKPTDEKEIIAVFNN